MRDQGSSLDVVQHFLMLDGSPSAVVVCVVDDGKEHHLTVVGMQKALVLYARNCAVAVLVSVEEVHVLEDRVLVEVDLQVEGCPYHRHRRPPYSLAR